MRAEGLGSETWLEYSITPNLSHRRRWVARMLEKRPTTPGPIEPAREQLGYLLLELNRPVEALPEFEASLEKASRRRGALSGAFHAAELTKDLSKAKHFKSELSATSSL